MSSRPAFLGMALLATALLAVLAWELDAAGPAEDQTGIVPIRHAPIARPKAAEQPDEEDHTDEWVETILARPLFSRDRKPTPVLAKSGGAVAVSTMPRLTGVMVGPEGARAIFAPAESNGKLLVASKGTTLGPYTVEAIEPGRVTVSGPEGTVKLQPSFDAAVRAAQLVAMPQPAQPQQDQQQGVPQRGVPLQPGQQPQPGQPPFMNLRPGTQFQRALSAIQNQVPRNQTEVDQ